MTSENATSASIRSSLDKKISEVEEKIASAALKNGRTAADVSLVLVSKYASLQSVQAALELGSRSFAENYVQNAVERFTPLKERFDDISLHFIGHLQRNKVRGAVGFFSLIQTVDSQRLLDAIAKEAAQQSITQRILIQVNVADDASKSGCTPENAVRLSEQAQSHEGIVLEGLMTIGRFEADERERRAEFIALRELRDHISAKCSIALPQLSMGMSSDFEMAIEEGATIVRIGSSVFGE